MAAGDCEDESRQLDETPTWAVVGVCAVIIFVSILLEKGLHHLGQWLTKKHKHTLVEALEKVKAELMILGFISLLLTFGQNYIAQICIPYKLANTMLPCPLNDKAKADGGKYRRLLWESLMDQNPKRRILAAATVVKCPQGKVPLISINGLHQLHILIFFLAVIHVVSSALIMTLGRAKIHGWNEWEKETQSVDYAFSNDPSRFRYADDLSFVRSHTSIWNGNKILFYVKCFFNQFFKAVSKADYFTLRHGFISVHLAPGTKFNFKRYIKRALEDDYNVVVGISPILWASALVVLLLNVNGWQELFWASLVPLVVVLTVGMKLQAIIASMAIEIHERYTVVQGIPLVHLSDQHFWFGHPQFLRFLIHFALFQNAFQISYFVWIWYYELGHCFHNEFGFIIARICIGIGGQILCSYITLPLYALVSQMGSHMKMSIFDDQTSKALRRWHQNVKGKLKQVPHSRTGAPSTGASPRAVANASVTISTSPVHSVHQHKTMGRTSEAHFRSSRRNLTEHGNAERYLSEHDNTDGEAEISASEMGQFGTQHLGPTAQELEVRLQQDKDGHPFSFVNLATPRGKQPKP
ncbi:MLO-like protein 9 isoform X1 [Canna indica]|uniref:MLO-like protein n=1 Tax=Canna indica TaxID=4628 RepID=A0AAQ3KFD9_9LILI|nr:MLO-like protein 9 isoform X1 [Canna indica]